MEQQPRKKVEYKVLAGNSLAEIGEIIEDMLNRGWGRASEIKTYQEMNPFGSGRIVFFQEFIREIQEETRQYDETAFVKAYGEMNQRVKDLLEINQVSFGFNNGYPVTYFGEECIDGFMAPAVVLARLKNSGHLPIDLDENDFISELGKLLCAF